MDLRGYYSRIREVEGRLTDPCVVVSLETPDGGRAGVRTEAPRRVAARMIIEGRARMASEDETHEYHQVREEARHEVEQVLAASRMQIVVAPAEWRGKRGSKE